MTIDYVTWTVFLHFIGNSFFHWPMWLSINFIAENQSRLFAQQKIVHMLRGTEIFTYNGSANIAIPWRIWIGRCSSRDWCFGAVNVFFFCKSASVEVPPMISHETTRNMLFLSWDLSEKVVIGVQKMVVSMSCAITFASDFWKIYDFDSICFRSTSKWWFPRFVYFHPSLGRWTKLTNMFKKRLKPPTRARDGLKLPPR